MDAKNAPQGVTIASDFTLIVYYGTDGGGGWQSLDRPLRTLTTLDRFGLVEWAGGEPTLRMLQVPELQRAMGFDIAYKLEIGTRRNRIKLLGNGVCPPVMQRIIESLVHGRQASGDTAPVGQLSAHMSGPRSTTPQVAA